MRPRKMRVAADRSREDITGPWSERDQAAFQRLIQRIGKDPHAEILGMFGSEARGLVSAPKSEVYDRASAFLSAINVAAALVLSAISGMVTSPIDVKSLPENQRVLGIAANMITYPMVAIQVSIVMFSTYVLLMFAAHGHSPDVIYRGLAHLGTLIGSFQVGIYLPLLLWLVQVVLLAHIHLESAWERWTCTALVAVSYAAFHVLFSYSSTSAFPRGMWGWLSITIPWLMFQDRVRSDVSRADGMYLASMEEAVMQGMSNTKLDGKAGPGDQVSPEEQQLTEWLDRVLPELGGHSMQRSLLIRALVNQDIELPALIKAGRISGGFRVLLEMLSFSLEEDGLELSRGDRLRLATAVMEEASAAEGGGAHPTASAAPP